MDDVHVSSLLWYPSLCQCVHHTSLDMDSVCRVYLQEAWSNPLICMLVLHWGQAFSFLTNTPDLASSSNLLPGRYINSLIRKVYVKIINQIFICCIAVEMCPGFADGHMYELQSTRPQWPRGHRVARQDTHQAKASAQSFPWLPKVCLCLLYFALYLEFHLSVCPSNNYCLDEIRIYSQSPPQLTCIFCIYKNI